MGELLEFLIDKCKKGLTEAKVVDTQLKGELEEIETLLKDRAKDIPWPENTKDVLYNLIFMLTDITTPHKNPAQILCFPCRILSGRQTRRNLQEIRTQLDGNKEEGGPSENSSRRWICKILPCHKRLLGQGTKKRLPNQNGGLASSEPAGGGIQENSSSSGWKEVSSEPEGWPEIEEKYILGFDDEIKKINHRLDFKNRRGHVEIGILGMCGSGKTTLAHRIYSQTSVAKDFNPHIWVSLPQVPPSKQRDFNQILRFILQWCGDGVYESAMDNYEKPQLLRSVRKNLLGKRYLLVLDGLWDADIEWYFELSRALDWQYKYCDLGDDGSESAVIVTTRQEEAAKTMVGTSGLHQIHSLLDEDTCWFIFIKKLESLKISSKDDDILMKEIVTSSSQELKKETRKEVIDELRAEIEHDDELKKEIKKQCDGLPLAAVTLAEIIPRLIHKKSNTLAAVTRQQQHAASSNPLTPSATITSGDIAPPTRNNRGGAE